MVNALTTSIKRGLHCANWIYFDENFMDKNLLHISLTKFNKLKINQLINQFKK